MMVSFAHLLLAYISDVASEDEVGAGSHSHPVYVIEISDTHSVFGNHWAGCEVVGHCRCCSQSAV